MDWTELPTIDAPRVTLRWISSDDVDALYNIFSNHEVMRYWSTPPLPDRNAAVELLDEIHDGFRRQSLLKWGVARRSDDVLIGTTTLYNLDFSNRRAEMGYALGRDHWGQGYMAESLQALLKYCFEVLTCAESKPMLIHETPLQFRHWKGSVFNAKDFCANAGKSMARSRTRGFMDCCGASGNETGRNRD